MPRLIPDWETDTVIFTPVRDDMVQFHMHFCELDMFYSKLSGSFFGYDDFYAIVEDGVYLEKSRMLMSVGTKYIIHNFPDIWLRDYMPLQTDEGFVKFIYNPRYNHPEWNSDIDKSVNKFMGKLFDDRPIKYVDLILDGGNFVHNGSIGITSERILSDNKPKTKEEIEKILKDNLFLEKIVFIPSEPYEKTGHVDGIIRWISPITYMVNRYDEYLKYEKKLKQILDKELPDFNRIEIPYIASSKSMHLTKGSGRQIWYDASGVYVNFLHTKNAVYIPRFDNNEIYPHISDNVTKMQVKFNDKLYPKDEFLEKFYHNFNKRVIEISSDAISKFGGIINCITWNFKQ